MTAPKRELLLDIERPDWRAADPPVCPTCQASHDYATWERRDLARSLAVENAALRAQLKALLSPRAIEDAAKALAFVGLSPHAYPDPDTTWAKAADAGGKDLFRMEARSAITAALRVAGDLDGAGEGGE